ncbi:unnamed protein product, partial [Symbiodinium necroappetens]
MATGVNLRTHRTGGGRHEVLGTTGNGSHDVRGCDIAESQLMPASGTTVQVKLESSQPAGVAQPREVPSLQLKPRPAGTSRNQPQATPAGEAKINASKRLQGHGAGSSSNDLHGHGKCAKCKERALDCL